MRPRARYRNRSLLNMGIWTSALVAVSLAMAWQFGWLPRQVSVVESENHADENASEEQKQSTAGSSTTAAATDTDPLIFTEQTEPVVGIGDAASASARRGRQRKPPQTLLSRRRDERREPSVPPRLPAARLASAAGPLIVPDRTGERRSVLPGRMDATAPRVNANRPHVVQTASQVPARQPVPPDRTQRAVPTRRPDLTAIDGFLAKDDYLAAHRELSKLYWSHPEWRPQIQKRIDRTARSIYFSPQPHYMPAYTIRPGDQLRRIARQYNVPWEYLVKLNRIDPRRIRPGQRLKVIKGPFGAVVDLSDRELTIHAYGYYVCRFPVGIGQDGTTPIGRFKVLNKVVDPQYTAPNGQVIAADDPSNPLGERWIDIGNHYGIHGTIDPKSIGAAKSRGCIRMKNSDVADVYDLLGVGSEVIIRH